VLMLFALPGASEIELCRLPEHTSRHEGRSPLQTRFGISSWNENTSESGRAILLPLGARKYRIKSLFSITSGEYSIQQAAFSERQGSKGQIFAL
jgi:hypothetical protein